MKKIIFLLLGGISLVSCSSDSTSEEDHFFNLKDGNLWVYRRYISNDDINYTATTYIDSVKVEGDTLINNQSYAKLVHRKYNSNSLYTVDKECLRVDANNHLVNQDGLVYHPGTDAAFHNVRTVQIGGNVTVGTIGEQLMEPFTTTIEGVDYFVYSYYGIFSPTDPSLPGNYVFYQYKKGLGLVCQRTAAVSGVSSTEDRLIYYDLN